ARFYILYIARTLWGVWTVRREWGRIGQRARGVRMDECDSEDEALLRAAEIIELRLRHRYVVK
ncbi:MAG: WGR domain-containing protein, partial [Anaerolineae bacterium]|nr:WGR domain-containing protein [Anaerolineae bacterium]